MLKKILIADHLIAYVDPVFKAVASGETLSPLECWCGAVGYKFQLYFDFSGYSDMAIGLSKFFNFNLPINFNSPYKASSLIDFWRRWHISLSQFLRDYLYIPLGGNKKGSFRRYVNLLTMLIGGLWHGANWTFAFWGGYHGVFLSLNHLADSYKVTIPLPKILKVLGTFTLVTWGWILFKSTSLSSALDYYKYLFNFNEYFLLPEGWSWIAPKLPFHIATREMNYFLGKEELACLFSLTGICLFGPNSQELVEKFIRIKKKSTFAFLFIFSFILFNLCLYNLYRLCEFTYFQF